MGPPSLFSKGGRISALSLKVVSFSKLLASTRLRLDVEGIVKK